MRISDWSSDVCSSDLHADEGLGDLLLRHAHRVVVGAMRRALRADRDIAARQLGLVEGGFLGIERHKDGSLCDPLVFLMSRSEEHTSELQSLMRISYAVFCLKKKKKSYNARHIHKHTLIRQI